MKNRSERNAEVITLNMLLSGVQIITERLEGMSYEDYIAIRKDQKALRKALKHKHKPNPKLQGLIPIKVGYNYHPKFITPPEEPLDKENPNNDPNNG